MKFNFPHKEGDIIPIYNNWENETEQIGTAKLVRFHRQGRSFILEDTYPEENQVVYNWQEWLVEWKPQIVGNPFRDYKAGDKVKINYDKYGNPQVGEPTSAYNKSLHEFRKVRYIDTIGIANSKDDEESEDIIQDKLTKDTFLE